MILAALTLWKRELVRFYRDKSRVIGAMVPPFVFWFLIGSGLGNSFRSSASPAGVSYLQYFFPGTVLLIVLFTAIFSTISVIEDRREGFLQSVLVAPIPRSGLVAGKILGGATLSFLQGLAFLLIWPWVGLKLTFLGLVFVLVALLLISVGLTGLGFVLAWRLDSTQGFHAIMNLFLIPMWMLSGALFPLAGAPRWLKALAAVNPMGYGLSALQQSFMAQGAKLSTGPSSAVCLGVMTGFALLTFAASVAAARKH